MRQEPGPTEAQLSDLLVVAEERQNLVRGNAYSPGLMGLTAERVAVSIDNPRWRDEALARTGDEDQAERVALMGGSTRRAKALVDVARAQTEAGRVDPARRLAGIAQPAAKTAEDLWAWDDAMIRVARALTRTGRTEEAETVALLVKDSHGRTVALVGLARALATRGDPAQAKRVAGLAHAAATAVKDPLSRVAALVSVVRALITAGVTTQADDVVGVVRTVAGEVEGRSRRGEALAGLARELADADQAERALQIADLIEEPRWRDDALGHAARAMARAGDLTQAEHVVFRVEERHRAGALAGLAREMADAGHQDRALRLAEMAQAAALVTDDPVMRDGALSAVVGVLITAGQAADAERVAHLIAHDRSQVLVLADVAQAMAAAGDEPQAVRVARSAETTACAVEDRWRRAETLVDAARAWARAGWAGEAERVAGLTKDPRRRAEALTHVARALADAGEHTEAARIARTVIGIVAGGEIRPFLIDPLEEAVTVLARCGCHDDAMTAVRTEIALATDLRRRDDAFYCERLATFCLKAADAAGSREEVSAWHSLARQALASAWWLGAEVWHAFDTLVCVAPDLAYRLVGERLLGGAEPS